MAATEPHFDQFDLDDPFLFFQPELIGTSRSFTTVNFNDDFDSYYYRSTGCDIGVDYFLGAAQRAPEESSEDRSTARETEQSPKTPQFSEPSDSPSDIQQDDATVEKPTGVAEKPKSNKIIPIKRRQPQSSHLAASKTGPIKSRAAKEMSLERNRTSAMKFRRKCKERERDLEARKGDFETKHRILKAEYADLLRETLRLKNDIIRHAGCHDCRVDAWIHSEAQKFVGSLSGAEQTSPQSTSPEST